MLLLVIFVGRDWSVHSILEFSAMERILRIISYMARGFWTVLFWMASLVLLFFTLSVSSLVRNWFVCRKPRTPVVKLILSVYLSLSFYLCLSLSLSLSLSLFFSLSLSLTHTLSLPLYLSLSLFISLCLGCSFELSGKEIFFNCDETKSKEEKNKKNRSKKKAQCGQSIWYRSWWKQGNIKMLVSEDHTSCWVHKDLTVTAKQIQTLLTAARASDGKDECVSNTTDRYRAGILDGHRDRQIGRLRLPIHSHSGWWT